MQIIINSLTASGIDRDPRSLEAEVYQNVRTLVSTELMSVPLDRGLGLDGDIIDAPLPQATAIITDRILALVAAKEPRADIRSIAVSGTVVGAIDGELSVSMTVRVRND